MNYDGNTLQNKFALAHNKKTYFTTTVDVIG